MGAARKHRRRHDDPVPDALTASGSHARIVVGSPEDSPQVSASEIPHARAREFIDAKGNSYTTWVELDSHGRPHVCYRGNGYALVIPMEPIPED